MVNSTTYTAFTFTTQPYYNKTVSVFLPIGLTVSGTGASTFSVVYPINNVQFLKNGSTFTPTLLTYSTKSTDTTTSYTTTSTGAFSFTRLFNLYVCVFTPTYENAIDTYTLSFSYTTPLTPPVSSINFCFGSFSHTITSGTFTTFPADFSAANLTSPFQYLSLSGYTETPYGLPTTASGITEIRDLIITGSQTYSFPSYLTPPSTTLLYNTINITLNSPTPYTQLSFPLSETTVLLTNGSGNANVILPDITGLTLPITFRIRANFANQNSNSVYLIPANNYNGSTTTTSNAVGFFNVNVSYWNTGSSYVASVYNISSSSICFFAQNGSLTNSVGLKAVNGVWYVYA